jgi:hypothetical protein
VGIDNSKSIDPLLLSVLIFVTIFLDKFIALMPTYAASTGPTVDWHARGLQIMEDLQEATYVTCLTLQVH